MCLSISSALGAASLRCQAGTASALSSSAASVAGLIKRFQNGENLSQLTAVCVITGHGLKDPDTALSIAADRVEVVADVLLVEEAMNLH